MEAQRLKPRDKDWLQERRTILKRIKDQVRLYLGPEPEDIRHYAEAYGKDVQRSWQASSGDAVLKAVEKAQVVFGGDFHAFPQAQRAHLRILRRLSKDKKVGLALEIFQESHQSLVDQFMANQISEEAFLLAISWEEKWGFPWSFYRPVLEFAKLRGWKVFGVNKAFDEWTEASLEARDIFAAQGVRKIILSGSVDLTYVIYGDLHIAQDHLPRAFRSLWPKGKQPSVVTVYLNPEKAYFELAEKALETQVDAIQYAEDQFAIVSSPPWVKWQNYLMFLEENHDYGLEDDEVENVDYTDHVSQLVRMMCSALQLDLSLNDMEVYTAKDRMALEKAQDLLEKKQLEFAAFLLRTDRSFYIPSQGFFYLSKPSVNHVATLAAQYVHAKISGRTNLLWVFPENFQALIWVEAMGFMLSKFVNPKRKAQTMNDLKKQLSVFHPSDEGREPLLLALDQKMAELLEVFKGESRGQKFRPRKKSSYIEAARFLGPILGERYYNLFERGEFSRDQMLVLLSFDPSQKGIAEFYYKQLAELDRLESKVRDIKI